MYGSLCLLIYIYHMNVLLQGIFSPEVLLHLHQIVQTRGNTIVYRFVLCIHSYLTGFAFFTITALCFLQSTSIDRRKLPRVI